MGGAPVSGFTNRQIYNTFGASPSNGPIERELFSDIYTKNQTDFTVDQSTLYYPQWTLAANPLGEEYITIVTRNPNESSPVCCMIGTSDRAAFSDFVVKAYSYSGVLQFQPDEVRNYFVSCWNMGWGGACQIENVPYTALSTVATPVITDLNNGKFNISCSTPGAEIYWRNSSLDSTNISTFGNYDWIEYVPNTILPLAAGANIQAIAYKSGMWLSHVANSTIHYTLKQPTIVLQTAPGSKYVTFSSIESNYIHGLIIKYKINNGPTVNYMNGTPVNVNTNDVVTAWTTKTDPSYVDSNLSTLVVS